MQKTKKTRLLILIRFYDLCLVSFNCRSSCADDRLYRRMGDFGDEKPGGRILMSTARKDVSPFRVSTHLVEPQPGRTRLFAQRPEFADDVLAAIGRVPFQQRFGALSAITAIFVLRVPDVVAVNDHAVQVVPVQVEVTVRPRLGQPAQHSVDGLQKRVSLASAHVSKTTTSPRLYARFVQVQHKISTRIFRS